MIDLGNLRQHQGEPFATYLQRWRSLYSRYPHPLPEREKIDIFINTLVPELFYDLRKQLFSSFNDMVESAYRIEDVAIRKGDIVINKDAKGNGKDKNKPWNKNKYVVNDGVVDAPKVKEPAFNLSNAIYAAKQQEAANTRSAPKPQYADKPKKSFRKRVYTKLAEPYDVILKTLVDNGYLTLPDKPGNWDPLDKPDWWREDSYCHYHRNKGHPTDNCFRLKDDIQDLIENGTISTDGLTRNSDHTAFKDPLPKHDKGETSQAHKKNHDAKINYTYPSNTPVINMVEPVESVLMVRSQDDNKANHGKPKLVLQTRGSSSSRSETLNVVTRGQAKIVLKTAQDPKQALPSKQAAPSATPSYDLVQHLQKMPAQISIFELLQLSPSHREILEKALHTAHVPKDIDPDQFQAMVNHISSPLSLSFSAEDDISIAHPHNLALHIEVLVYNTRVRRVLIDNGAGLNIVSFNVIQQLGLSEFAVDSKKKITIKAYDEEERSSKGLVTLPVRVGPITKDISFQVLDIPLAYNILLGRPWIHDMQAVPSTFHQCVKFPYNGTEVVIPGDHTIAINALAAAEKFVPHNEPSVDPSTSLVAAEKSLKMMSLGMGEYTLDSFASIPVSPRSYGKPSDTMKPSTSAMVIFDTFIPSSIPLEEEREEQAIQEWIYREDSRNTPMLSNSDTDTDESPLHTMAHMGDDLPSTSLLWGEACMPTDDIAESSMSRTYVPKESLHYDRQRHNIERLLQRGDLSHNDMSVSTSQHIKPLPEDSSMTDMDVDVVHISRNPPDVVDESCVGSDEFVPRIALVDYVGPPMTNLDLATFGAYPIGSTSLVTRDDIPHINAIEPVTPFHLASTPVTSSTSELATKKIESEIKHHSHQVKRKEQWSDGENHIVAVSEPKKSKDKNLLKNNDSKIKDEKLILYKQMVHYFKHDLITVILQPIPKAEKRVANALVTLISILQMKKHKSRFKFLVDELRYPAHKSYNPTIFPCLPPHTPPCHSFRHPLHFAFVSGGLYRKGLDGTLLRCLEIEESEKVLAEIHDGICGSHSNDPPLTQTLLRAGYYWSNWLRPPIITAVAFGPGAYQFSTSKEADL